MKGKKRKLVEKKEKEKKGYRGKCYGLRRIPSAGRKKEKLGTEKDGVEKMKCAEEDSQCKKKGKMRYRRRCYGEDGMY